MPFRWLWYLLRVLFCTAYAVVAFFSKPGARYIIIAGLAAAAWLFFPWAQLALHHSALWLAGDAQPETFLLGLMLALSLLWLACPAYGVPGTWALLLLLLMMWGACLYGGSRTYLMAQSARDGHTLLLAVLIGALLANGLLSLAALARMLALVLGTFPPPPWPLRPRELLKANNRVITPAPVALAVPPLHRAPTGAAYHLHAALPPEVAALLTPRRSR